MIVTRAISLLCIVFFFVVFPVRKGECCEFTLKEDRFFRLQQARSWMYQIQDLDTDEAIEALANTKYPLLVVEPNHNIKDTSFNSRDMLQTLQTMSNGKQRLVLAYIDVGQAEDWRTYWQDDWVAPTSRKPGYPDFLITVDPDGWKGCYPVAYWDKRWKDIWLGSDGIIAGLAEMGFDGVYMDWIEAYDDEQVRNYAAKSGINPALEMIKFVEEIGAAGKEITPDFLIVPQNAPFLIDEDPERYVWTIDALAVEDTWFHGKADADWDDPEAGDLRNRYDGEWSTENRLIQYKKYLQRGVPVFSVDYCLKKDNAKKVYNESRRAGLRPLVTRVSLSRISETPPESYDTSVNSIQSLLLRKK